MTDYAEPKARSVGCTGTHPCCAASRGKGRDKREQNKKGDGETEGQSDKTTELAGLSGTNREKELHKREENRAERTLPAHKH